MPLSLRELQKRDENCLESIEEMKEKINEIDVAKVSFKATVCFNGLRTMTREDIERFLLLFPQLPKILVISRQAANGEIKRRNLKTRIDKLNMERVSKVKRMLERESKKERKTQRRLKKLSSYAMIVSESSQD